MRHSRKLIAVIASLSSVVLTTCRTAAAQPAGPSAPHVHGVLAGLKLTDQCDVDIRYDGGYEHRQYYRARVDIYSRYALNYGKYTLWEASTPDGELIRARRDHKIAGGWEYIYKTEFDTLEPDSYRAVTVGSLNLTGVGGTNVNGHPPYLTVVAKHPLRITNRDWHECRRQSK
jgi:hypothetical protein